jgi:N-acyl-D-amino-acid deacylase
MLDLVVAGGRLYDGTGGPARRADVGVTDGRIVTLGDLSAAEAGARIDAAGHAVAPGFVDIHSHSDLSLLSAPGAPSKIRQGVTTEINGNCGMGPFPNPPARAVEIRSANANIDNDLAVAWDWQDLPGYAEAVARTGIALNQALLVGHMPLRVAAAGQAARPLDATETTALVRYLHAALDDGAVGFSTGLMFPPAMFAERDELLAIGRTVAEHDRVFAAHFRNYSDRMLEGVEEMLDLARTTGCRLQLSHLAVAGRRNWGKVPRALALIDAARRDGLDVACDIYPYVAGSANLSQLLPEWAQAGGAPGIVERLGRPSEVDRILHDWETELFFGWDAVEVASLEPGMAETLGLTVDRVGALWGMDGGRAAMELIRRSEDRVTMIAFGRSEDDLRAALRHEARSIGSDGLAMTPDGPTGAGRPHPRNYGGYPRFLGRYVRDDAIVPLEQAIAMCTSRPADRVGLTDRGRIAEGAAADLVVFDPATVLDTATFQVPAGDPIGIRDVIVGGVPVVRDGTPTGGRPGRVLTA